MDSTPGPSRTGRRSRVLPGPPSRTGRESLISGLAYGTPQSTPPNGAVKRSRNSILVYSPPDSTPNTPSLSAPPPFDWEALRNGWEPPYGTPKSNSAFGNGVQNGRHGDSKSGGSGSGSKKRIFRKPNIIEKMRALPSHIMFEISMFPHNVPLPPPKTTGQLIGGFLHLTHMTVKWWGRSNAVRVDDPDAMWKSEVEWEFGDEPVPTKSWTGAIVTFLLLLTAILNTLYLFTRIRTYQLQMRNELVKSKHASIVSKDTFRKPTAMSTSGKVFYMFWETIKIAWRLAFGKSKSPEDMIPVDLQIGANKIQQLEVWSPGELETEIFIVYSPAHFLIWRIFASTNWFWALLLLGVTSLQAHALIFTYEALIKDKAILSAEMLHEYDVRFVNPRLHAPKRDVGTSTNEAEMTGDWRKYGR